MNASLLFDVDDSLGWDAPDRNPARDGPLRFEAKSASEGRLPSGSLAGQKNRLLAHRDINAQNVNMVNAYSVTATMQNWRVGKRAETEPSDFWRRMTEAWAKRGLPTSQNGVATELGMSQGSTRRWYMGEGFPEIDKLRIIAAKGDVTVDWLLMATLPRSPIGDKTLLGQFLKVWDQLDEAGQGHIYRAALGQLALKKPELREITDRRPPPYLPQSKSQ